MDLEIYSNLYFNQCIMSAQLTDVPKDVWTPSVYMYALDHLLGVYSTISDNVYWPVKHVGGITL
jgi:hypothetical protein